jgi:hypothetical protein
VALMALAAPMLLAALTAKLLERLVVMAMHCGSALLQLLHASALL